MSGRLYVIGRIEQALQLVNALAAIIELDTPFPPRKQTSRDATLATSLLVIRQELDHALDVLAQTQPMGLVAGIEREEVRHAVL
jgi:hypothetical protein